MKVNIKTIIGLILATLILIGGTYSVYYYLHVTSEKMLSKVSTIEDLLTKDDLESAEKVAVELSKQWTQYEKKWTTLTSHHEIDSVTTSLKNTLEFIRFNDVANSMANLEALRHYIEHIPSMEEFTIRNIL